MLAAPAVSPPPSAAAVRLRRLYIKNSAASRASFVYTTPDRPLKRLLLVRYDCMMCVMV